jgi:nucleoside-diphosphate-sugar epimerase
LVFRLRLSVRLLERNCLKEISMRVFVTGATGFVGQAVVQELIGAGHRVLGLTRSDKGAAALIAAGADPHHGTMDDLASLRAGAAQADGVIHLAFNHDFSKFADNCEQDRQAILAMGEVLEGSDRPLLVTSGVALLTEGGRTATEADAPAPGFPRLSEVTANELAARGIRATSVRLPPTTHGYGDHGFVPHLIGLAREKGVSAYIGDGGNRWPAGHRVDAAKVFRLALERGAKFGGPLGGPFHAIAEEGIAFKEIAAAIARGLNLPLVSKTPDEAAGHFAWFTMFAGMDVPTSSARTRALLGWQPTEAGVIADMEAGYFADAEAAKPG